MNQLCKEEVQELVEKIRMGLGDDDEINLWIELIKQSVPNRQVVEAIMVGTNATIEDIMNRLYTTNIIQL